MGNCHKFSSKFHTLSTSAKFLKIGKGLTKLQTVKRWELFWDIVYIKDKLCSKNSTMMPRLAMTFDMCIAWPQQTETGYVWYRSVFRKTSFVTKMFRIYLQFWVTATDLHAEGSDQPRFRHIICQAVAPHGIVGFIGRWQAKIWQCVRVTAYYMHKLATACSLRWRVRCWAAS